MSSRIAVLELRSVRGTGGGPEKTILLGAEQANQARFAVTICYVRDSRDEVFGIDQRAFAMDLAYIEVRERHSFDRRIWRQLTALVQERQIDIVHSHDYKTDLIALLLARRTGVIPLATAHGWTGQTARERFAYYPADQWLLARFPRVIAVSSEIKLRLIERGAAPERVVVLLNAIDPDQFRRSEMQRPLMRTALGYGDGDIVIGAVGRLERQKRFDLLLDAFASLSPTHPRLRLAIAGDGSLRAELQSQALRLGIAQQCAWLGHRNDVADLHHAFDIFVQSSEYEGTPNAVLEAMAMETPLVATDVGGTRELASPDVHASLVPPQDAGRLASAIRAVIDDPASARTRAREARRRIESELSFAARTRALENIYQELISESRAGPRRFRSSPAVIRA
jgi:glycosyltransferase involved in cell wall biosynthesis